MIASQTTIRLESGPARRFVQPRRDTIDRERLLARSLGEAGLYGVPGAQIVEIHADPPTGCDGRVVIGRHAGGDTGTVFGVCDAMHRLPPMPVVNRWRNGDPAFRPSVLARWLSDEPVHDESAGRFLVHMEPEGVSVRWFTQRADAGIIEVIYYVGGRPFVTRKARGGSYDFRSGRRRGASWMPAGVGAFHVDRWVRYLPDRPGADETVVLYWPETGNDSLAGADWWCSLFVPGLHEATA